jgi:glycosyltransferase involved in cell wall biosynthesis
MVCFTGVFAASLHADCIVAISNYTSRHFLEIFPYYPADRVVVAYLASRFSGRSNRAKLANPPLLEPEHFWLNVGTLEPRKNHRRLLQAYARLKAQGLQTFPQEKKRCGSCRLVGGVVRVGDSGALSSRVCEESGVGDHLLRLTFMREMIVWPHF